MNKLRNEIDIYWTFEAKARVCHIYIYVVFVLVLVCVLALKMSCQRCAEMLILQVSVSAHFWRSYVLPCRKVMPKFSVKTTDGCMVLMNYVILPCRR